MADRAEAKPGLRWWIGGLYAAAALLFAVAERHGDKVDRRRQEIILLGDSLAHTAEADSAFEAEFRRIDSLQLRRGFISRSAAQPGPAYEELAREARGDSADLAVLLSLVSARDRQENVRLRAAALGAEAEYWHSCLLQCDMGQSRKLQADIRRISNMDRLVDRRLHTDIRSYRGRLDEAERQRTRALGVYRGATAATFGSALVALVLSLLAITREFSFGRRFVARAATSGAVSRARLVSFFVAKRASDALVAVVRFLVVLDQARIITVVLAAGAAAGFLYWVSAWWLSAWMIVYVGQEVLHVYRRRVERQVFEGRLAPVSGSFGGNIGTLAQRLQMANGTQSEESAKSVCTGLLHRARHVAEIVTDARHGIRFRATLAVPIEATEHPAGEGKISSLRVWCYDEPYGNRRWSVLPVDLPGAGAAYRRGSIEIIEDLRAVPRIGDLGNTDYLSVVSFPIMIGSVHSGCLGVVSIDCTQPKYFDDRNVARLAPFLLPILATIGLVLLTIDSEDDYVFEA